MPVYSELLRCSGRRALMAIPSCSRPPFVFQTLAYDGFPWLRGMSSSHPWTPRRTLVPAAGASHARAAIAARVELAWGPAGFRGLMSVLLPSGRVRTRIRNRDEGWTHRARMLAWAPVGVSVPSEARTETESGLCSLSRNPKGF